MSKLDLLLYSNCHTRILYDSNGEITGEEPILDEYGDTIPLDVCICAAHCSTECCCGAWDMDWNNQYAD